MRAFHSDECVDDLCIDMLKLFLPCFMTLLSSRLEKDTQTIEHVRSRWCELLNNDYAGEKSAHCERTNVAVHRLIA